MNERPTDRDLLIAFGQRGDQAALEALILRWDQRVLAFLAKATGDYEAARDLRQEVFLRLYRYGSTYKAEFAFTTWFFRLVRNVLFTWRARQAKAPRTTEAQADRDRIVDLRPTPRETAAQRETLEAVMEAIEELTASERELLLLRFDVGLSYREIAEIQETPETTIKSRVYTLLGRLKERLESGDEAREARAPAREARQI